MQYTIQPISWEEGKHALRDIRKRVFIDEQQVPQADEWDGKDEAATHFLVTTNSGEAIGCARLLNEIHDGNSVFQVGRVAILAAYRQQNIGRDLMREVINYCKQVSAQNRIYLHAQITRQHFYEHLDFVACGDVFMDAGIPHIEMWYK